MSEKTSEFSLEDLLNITPEELEKLFAGRRLRLENPWVLDLIKVLYPHSKGLRRSIVLTMVARNRKTRGHEMPKAVEETIQSAFQHYCVDSKVFRNRKGSTEDGLFHWPNGAGAGVWACYQEKVQTWLKERGIRI